MKTEDFSKTIAASDLKGGRSRHLIEYMKICGDMWVLKVKVISMSCTYKNSNWIFSGTTVPI